MYIFRANNSTYYTRITLPKPLYKRGFPFDVKVSLLTKERSVGIERNFVMANTIKQVLKTVTAEQLPAEFKYLLDTEINKVRESFLDSSQPQQIIFRSTRLPIQKLTTPVISKPTKMLDVALADFIVSKSKESIRTLTVHQLNQRASHFIAFSAVRQVNEVSTADAMIYRDKLLKEGRSYKTNKEYLAAIRQFFSWCITMNYCDTNPFYNISLGKKPSSRLDAERRRWKLSELKRLFKFNEYQQQTEQFHWTTSLMLYHGLRPSEACQLHLCDIRSVDNIDCLVVTDEGDKQRVKNESAKRFIPIHPDIYKQGFLDYLRRRQELGKAKLFDYTPSGSDNDWSATYRNKLGNILSKAGFKPHFRPTAYGFRHTFIDELKQLEVPEYVVAQIVGHTNPNITYGRYGKRLKTRQLLSYVTQLEFDLKE